MQKLIYSALGLGLILPLTLSTPSARAQKTPTTYSEITVTGQIPVAYICPTPNSYAFHLDSTCRFLRQCSNRIVPVIMIDSTLLKLRKPCDACAKGKVNAYTKEVIKLR